MAQDLTAWTQNLCLEDELADVEPKRLRYCIFHAAGRLVTTGRRLICASTAPGPGRAKIADVFKRLERLSLQT